MGKLVRDRIPEIVEASGREPVVRVLDEASYEQALLDKLLEEAQELRDAAPAARLEEAADVYEVLLSIADLIGVGFDQLVARAETRRAERGGFRERLWMDG